MGFRTAWIARRNDPSHTLAHELGWEPEGTRRELPEPGMHLLSLQNGAWSMVLADGDGWFSQLTERDAARVSAPAGETLWFWCSDTSSCSELVCHRAGRVVWSVRCGGEESGEPVIDGSLPAEAVPLVVAMRAQLGADPLDMAPAETLAARIGEVLTGFRHDLLVEGDDPAPYRGLRRRPSQAENASAR